MEIKIINNSKSDCTFQVFLYLQNNAIAKVKGLERLVNLEVLNLRGNHIRRLDRSSFPRSLSKLFYLNLRENKLNRIKDFRRLKHLPSLTTLLCFNNAYDNYLAGKEVRAPILAHLKRLRRLNKTEVTVEERQELEFLEGTIGPTLIFFNNFFFFVTYFDLLVK